MTAETSIYEFARQGMSLFADNTALWFYGWSITYRELFRRIDNVADNLYLLGVKQGVVVTVHLPNCPQAVMAIYAIAKLGGICNMVHPQIPLDMLREKMRFTDSSFLITGSHFVDCAAVDFADRIVYVDIAAHMGLFTKLGYYTTCRTRAPLTAFSFERLERKASRSATMPIQKELSEKCVMYLHSSGTAGEPKTVMHCHRALNLETIGIREGCRLGSVNKDVLLGVMPMYHGIGLVDDIHSAISGGTKIVQMASWNAKYAAKLIRKHKVSIMTVVPKIYYDLMRQTNYSPKNYRKVFSGGEAIDPEFKNRFFGKTGHLIYEGYGLTELVAPCGVEQHDGVNHGYMPFPGNKFAVCNPNGEISSVGEGELIVLSETVMMGYLKDEVATEQAFVRWNNQKWVRTGDYGTVDALGNFTFRERLKYIIIQNGNNIFPGDIETIILQSGLVKETCVVGIRNDQTFTQNVCAFVVPHEFCLENLEQRILDYCATRLPGYAIPKYVCRLQEIPRTVTGKADRNALERNWMNKWK